MVGHSHTHAKGMSMTNTTQEKYGSTKTVAMPFDQAVERTRSVLQENGWGVMTEIDVTTTFKQKMGVDFPRYMILGACQPQLAKEALDAEPMIGLLMPCNVVIQEREGKVQVSVVDANQVVSIVKNSKVDDVGRRANDSLKTVLANI
jgi:uncharacterized protein (DUF302 family)